MSSLKPHLVVIPNKTTLQVQLQTLTAVVKLFLKKPDNAQGVVQKVLETATKDCDSPDVRDRAYIYWRLLSTDPAAAKVCLSMDVHFRILTNIVGRGTGDATTDILTSDDCFSRRSRRAARRDIVPRQRVPQAGGDIHWTWSDGSRVDATSTNRVRSF